MRVTACYMVKDEEKNLATSIQSVQAAVDELIVVDTGSQDKTRDIAIAYGAKLYDYPWQDDFSAPRNFAIEQATGDWIIFLDADESFRHPELVRDEIERLVARSDKTDAIMLILHELDQDEDYREKGSERCLRIFRRAEHLRYKGRIHENIQNQRGMLNLVYAGESLALNHTGYSSQRIQSKLERNLNLLQRDIAENGEQPHHYMYLADCYFGLRDYEKTLHYALLAIESPAQAVAGASSAFHRAIESMRQLRYPEEQMLILTQRAIQLFPHLPEFHAEQGMVFCGMGRLGDAYGELLRAAELWEHPVEDTRESSYMIDGIDKVYARLAELELRVHHYRQARQHVEKALAYAPDNETAQMLQKKFDRDKGITACYIVRDEAGQLERSLQSLQGQVDHILIADTGSTDDTVAVAKRYGAEVFSFPWQDDFAAARNAVLERACGSWLVFLDADEYFTAETAGNLRETIRTADATAVKGLLTRRVDVDTANGNEILADAYVMRIFRNLPDFSYEGIIHEELRENGQDIQPLAQVPTEKLLLWHTGYAGPLVRQKAERNLRLLLTELKTTKHPGRLYGYLADVYYSLDDAKQAEKYARLDVEQGRRGVTYASRSYRILFALLAKQPMRAKQRLELAAAAVRDFPELPEFHAEYAECLAADGQYAEAVTEMTQALQTYPKYDGMEPMLFTEELARKAEVRMQQWKHKSGEETQIVANPYHGKESEALLQDAVNEIKKFSLALLYMDDAEFATQEMDRLLPAPFYAIIRSYHGDKHESLDYGIYEVLLKEVLRHGDAALRSRFAQLAIDSFAPAELCRAAQLYFAAKEWQCALLLYEKIPADSELADGRFWYETGVTIFQLGEKEIAAECLEKAKQLQAKALDIDAYLAWCTMAGEE